MQGADVDSKAIFGTRARTHPMVPSDFHKKLGDHPHYFNKDRARYRCQLCTTIARYSWLWWLPPSFRIFRLARKVCKWRLAVWITPRHQFHPWELVVLSRCWATLMVRWQQFSVRFDSLSAALLWNQVEHHICGPPASGRTDASWSFHETHWNPVSLET